MRRRQQLGPHGSRLDGAGSHGHQHKRPADLHRAPRIQSLSRTRWSVGGSLEAGQQPQSAGRIRRAHAAIKQIVRPALGSQCSDKCPSPASWTDKSAAGLAAGAGGEAPGLLIQGGGAERNHRTSRAETEPQHTGTGQRCMLVYTAPKTEHPGPGGLRTGDAAPLQPSVHQLTSENIPPPSVRGGPTCRRQRADVPSHVKCEVIMIHHRRVGHGAEECEE